MAFFPHTPALSPTSAQQLGRAVVPNPQREHDAELVKRCNAGQEDAFVEIVTSYRQKMFATAYSLLRNHADAEEIVQDTFIRAHRGLAQFRGDSSLSTWLHCIAFNLSRNRYWYFHRRHRRDTLSFNSSLHENSDATLADFIASTAPDPAREATNQEFVQQVAGCMERLSTGHREILILRNIKDHSYEQISRILGITVGTVKSRIARARTVLRGLLEECYSSDVSDALLSFPRLQAGSHAGGGVFAAAGVAPAA